MFSKFLLILSFSLIILSIRILTFFCQFTCFIVFKSLLAIPLLIDNAKIRLALVISTRAPIKVANKTVETPPAVVDKTNKFYQDIQTLQYIH